jgi:Mechanosensitive ion channel.
MKDNALAVYTGILLLLLVFILDMHMRKRNTSRSRIKVFEAFSIFLILVYVIIATDNITILAVASTTFLSLAWAFRELLSNLGSTIVMYMYPQYNKNDILTVKGESDLQFDSTGFLRSKMKKTSGELVYVPNRMLLNDLVIIQAK